MWAAQYFGFEKPNKWLTSGGLGTMGYGMPAAIGAQLGNPDSLVIDIAGEASIMAMIEHDGPVMVDCHVSKEANCFPMIPSGAAHTEMLLYGDMVEGTMDDEAKALV